MKVHRAADRRVFLDIETVADEGSPFDCASRECRWRGPFADALAGPDEGTRLCPVCGSPIEQRGALHLTHCRIVSMAIAVDDADVVSWSAADEWAAMDSEGYVPADKWADTETAVLDWLRQQLGAHGITKAKPGIVVTYNGRAFDVPRLHMAALARQHPILPWFPMPRPGVKPWDPHGDAERHHDVLDIVSGGGWNRSSRCTQSELAARLGVASDLQPGSGAEVADWHRTGHHDKIVQHNRADVVELRECYRRVVGWRLTTTTAREGT
jgi:hypothetical protein